MIETLVSDMYRYLDGQGDASPFSRLDFTEALKNVHTKAQTQKERSPKTLYFSELGDPCPRKLNYRVNSPDLAEKLEPNTRLKFFYGDILEGLLLSLAEASGHHVSNQQGRATLDLADGWKVTGRIDAEIDGVLVDVKSTTKFGEEKFKGGLVDDPFGYKMQLGGYAVALERKEAGFLTIQKELGHLGYYPIKVDKGAVMEGAAKAVEAVTGNIDSLPRIAPVAQSKTSKNTKLDTTCSYCPYKKKCYPEARTFLYSTGPVFLIDVVDTPRVDEI